MVKRPIFVSVFAGLVVFAVFFALDFSLRVAVILCVATVINTYLALSLKLFSLGWKRFKKRRQQRLSLPNEARKARAGKGKKQGWSMKILIVDPDPAHSLKLSAVAGKKGFDNVTTAKSGKAALSLMSKTNEVFECIFLDLAMPETDGVKMCRRIRDMDAYQRTPIIVLSDKNDLGRIADAFTAGATDFATKPFVAKEIAMRLQIAQATQLAMHTQNRFVHDYDRHLTMQTPDTGFDLVRDGQLTGTSALVQQSVFLNYLTQLPTRLLPNVHVYALSVPDLGLIRRKAEPEEFLGLFEDLAGAAERCISSSLILMTYDKHGSLLIMTESSFRFSAQHIETEIKRHLKAVGKVYGGQDAASLRLGVGEPILPKGAKEQRARMTIDRALLLAADRNTRNESRGAGGAFLEGFQAVLDKIGAFATAIKPFKSVPASSDSTDLPAEPKNAKTNGKLFENA